MAVPVVAEAAAAADAALADALEDSDSNLAWGPTPTNVDSH